MIDGTGADGKPLHSEWTGQFDGKDYPVTGDPITDMRSFKKVDDHTLLVTQKKDYKLPRQLESFCPPMANHAPLRQPGRTQAAKSEQHGCIREAIVATTAS